MIYPHIHNYHWTCVVVDFESRSIFSADSMSGQHEDFVKHVCGFMDIASHELRGEAFDFGGAQLCVECRLASLPRGSLRSLVARPPPHFPPPARRPGAAYTVTVCCLE